MAACVSREMCVEFLADRLSARDADDIAEHVEECDRCSSLLEELADDRELRQWAQGARDVTVVGEDSAIFAEQANAVWLGSLAAITCPDRQPEVPLATDQRSAAIPERLGQYELLGPLGQGGMGTVYEALHVRLKRRVALKIIVQGKRHDTATVDRFFREMEAIGRLHHPQIVQAYDAGECDGTPYLAMELVDGADLERIARARRSLPIADACEAVRQAALGLQHAHEHGLIHRDVKPSNLLLARDGTIKLADLGLARLSAVDGEWAEMTGSGYVLGTADYMAPEQGVGNGRPDRRADLYSLGCVLYRLLAGQPPYHGPRYSTNLKKLLGHATDPVRPLGDFRNDVPAALESVLVGVLHKDPAGRTATAAELAQALTPFCEGADLRNLALTRTIDASGQQTVAFLRTTSANAPPVLLRRRFFWPLGLLFAATVLVALLLGSRWWTGPAAAVALPAEIDKPGSSEVLPGVNGAQLTQPVLGPAVFEETPAQLLPIPATYPLLVRPPKELYWPHGDPLSRYDYNEQLRQVIVSCHDFSLLSLGSVQHKEFTVRLDFHQYPWSEGLGFFFGYRKIADDRPDAVFQLLRLLPNIDENRDEYPLRLVRSQITLGRTPSGGAYPREFSFRNAFVKVPLNQGCLLEVTIGHYGLHSVRWGGKDLPELCDGEANRRFSPEDYRGDFGVYNLASNCIVRNASIEIRK